MIEFTTPVGRIVSGNVFNSTTKDHKGRDKFKKGTDQLLNMWKLGIAIPKNPGEQFWYQTEWGQQIIGIAAAAFPSQYPNSWNTFSWKVYDGDDIKVNEKGVRYCDREGHAGCWIIYLLQYYCPQTVNRDGSEHVTDPNAIKPGYWIQVKVECKSNQSTDKPGVFLSHQVVSLQAYGDEIQLGSRPDPKQCGFGNAALPAGATTTPPAGMTPTPAAAPAAPVPAIAAPVTPVAAPVPPVAPVAAAPVAAPLAPAAPAPVYAAPVVPTPPGVAPGPVVATVAPVAAPVAPAAPGAPVPPLYTPPQN